MTSLWGTDLFDSVNCVVVSGKRSGVEKVAACCIRATTRADVNHAVKKKLDVRKCSFMPMDEAVERTGHGTRRNHPEFGLGQWPIWLDSPSPWRDRNRLAPACGLPRSACPARSLPCSPTPRSSRASPSRHNTRVTIRHAHNPRSPESGRKSD